MNDWPTDSYETPEHAYRAGKALARDCAVMGGGNHWPSWMVVRIQATPHGVIADPVIFLNKRGVK